MILQPGLRRDEKYYFEDASTVLLVGEVLFKINLSLLSPKLEQGFYDPHLCIQFLTQGQSPTGTGKTDTDPLIVHDVTAIQFRHWLLALLGRPGDNDYMQLLTGVTNHRSQIQALFTKYLDIGTLANRFQMSDLTAWAQSQLILLFRDPTWADELDWSKDELLRISAFGECFRADHKFSLEIQTFLQYILTPSPSCSLNKWPYASVCTSLYKSSASSGMSKVLAGWVSLFILSQGHRSPVWSGDMSRDDLLVLYAAQAELTNLPGVLDLNLTWLTQAKDPQVGILRFCCAACFPHYQNIWSSSIGRAEPSGSVTPLEDVHDVLFLPYYRQLFARDVRSFTPCGRQCGEKLLYVLDTHISELFRGFYQIFERLKAEHV
ncbi:unnamed protein product [Rhizoctonia solani]|uniref:BTB domain-containing protein n=1 Tax=Rhizoctonia solani TaxID=456999 RepID=A0A8H3CX39_9AGAM|nr:unnamed protein product [Rhizoctonia solani]